MPSSQAVMRCDVTVRHTRTVSGVQEKLWSQWAAFRLVQPLAVRERAPPRQVDRAARRGKLRSRKSASDTTGTTASGPSQSTSIKSREQNLLFVEKWNTNTAPAACIGTHSSRSISPRYEHAQYGLSPRTLHQRDRPRLVTLTHLHLWTLSKT